MSDQPPPGGGPARLGRAGRPATTCGWAAGCHAAPGSGRRLTQRYLACGRRDQAPPPVASSASSCAMLA